MSETPTKVLNVHEVRALLCLAVHHFERITKTDVERLCETIILQPAAQPSKPQTVIGRTREERSKEELLVLLKEAYEDSEYFRQQWNAAKSELSPLCERVEVLENGLRSANDLQHRMAIEMQHALNAPRIEHWTRQIEDVICAALDRMGK